MLDYNTINVANLARRDITDYLPEYKHKGDTWDVRAEHIFTSRSRQLNRMLGISRMNTRPENFRTKKQNYDNG